MDSSIGKMIYCSISKGNRIVYSYNGGDRDTESLAARCLEKAPPFHAQYFHTVGPRTFGFLIEDGHTYFAIIDANSSTSTILQLLEKIRDGFKNHGFQEELLPIIKRLISSLETMNQTADHSSNSMNSMSGSINGVSCTKAPLLGMSRSGKADRAAAKIDVMPEPVVGNSAAVSGSMQKSLSSRARGLQTGRRMWWRHVKIVVAVDVFLCLVLFGVWMVICRGFECVS